jgi:hypothetical protein
MDSFLAKSVFSYFNSSQEIFKPLFTQIHEIKVSKKYLIDLRRGICHYYYILME